MTQYHVAQAKLVQSEAPVIIVVSESTRLMLHRLAVGIVATVAIACQAESPTALPTVAVSSAPIVETATIPSGNATYQSDRFGFHFTYADDQFVAKAETDLGPDVVALEAIQIWTTEHDQEINAGDYEGGTEYPANVSITVQPAPNGLTLQDCVQQSDWFSESRNIKETTVAGQAAIAFQSSGLYEADHVALATPDGAAIVLVTLNKINDDAGNPYQTLFEQIVSSLTFNP